MSVNNVKRWLTFDCYDTLVRYTESKSATMTELISTKGGTKDLVDSAWSVFQSSERRLQTEDFLPLNQVLKKSLKFALNEIGFESTTSDEDKMLLAVKDANPFLALKDEQNH